MYRVTFNAVIKNPFQEIDHNGFYLRLWRCITVGRYRLVRTQYLSKQVKKEFRHSKMGFADAEIS